MKTLVIADYVEQPDAAATLADASARTVKAAAQVSSEMTVLVIGSSVDGVASKVAALEGVDKVWQVDTPEAANKLADVHAGIVASLAEGFDAVFAPASSYGKDTLPRVAATLDVMQISDVTGIVNARTFIRPIYAGNALQTLETGDNMVVATIRASAFQPAGLREVPAPIEQLDVEIPVSLIVHESDKVTISERPDLGSAEIVVSGGRGLGSEEAFNRVLLPFADALGAAVGASRAAVDAGYAPNDWQVGQTGKIVAPDFYFAVGLSGAIQHLAGMKDSKVIVAINNDPEAPIFDISDYGLVGDLFEELPKLRDLLK